MYVSPITPAEQLPEVDVLLVLGRGIDCEGSLSETSKLRAELGAHISRLAVNQAVVFSGGRSWRQVLNKENTPSEGGAMLDYTLDWLGSDAPDGVQLLAEEASTSTLENFVLSKRLWEERGLRPGTVGVLSDTLHFSHGRIHLLGALALPGITKYPFRFEDPSVMSPENKREEIKNSLATKVLLAGAPYGNDNALLKRQALKTSINTMAHRVLTRLPIAQDPSSSV